MSTRTILWGMLLILAAVVAQLAPANEPATPSVAGFTDSALGYARLPAPQARYRDADFEVAGGADPRWNPWNPRHMEASRVRAERDLAGVRNMTRHPYLLSLRGDRDGAAAGLAKAREKYPDSVGLHWSEGWIRLNLLDFEGALVAWQQAEKLHGGEPFWVPYSKAIALIGAGDDQAALAWWRVAQAARAPELDSASSARQHFSHWRTTEKLLLEELVHIAYADAAPVAIVDRSHSPRMTHAPIPAYPVDLLRQGIEGEVLVKLKIGLNGLPGQVAIARSSGHAAFDEEALRVARLARFEVPKGAAAPVWGLVPYRYKLAAAPAAGAGR